MHCASWNIVFIANNSYFPVIIDVLFVEQYNYLMNIV